MEPFALIFRLGGFVSVVSGLHRQCSFRTLSIDVQVPPSLLTGIQPCKHDLGKRDQPPFASFGKGRRGLPQPWREVHVHLWVSLPQTSIGWGVRTTCAVQWAFNYPVLLSRYSH